MCVCVCVCAAKDVSWKNSDVSIAVVHYVRQAYSACLFFRQDEVLTLGTLVPRTSSGQSSKYRILMMYFLGKGQPVVFKVG